MYTQPHTMETKLSVAQSNAVMHKCLQAKNMEPKSTLPISSSSHPNSIQYPPLIAQGLKDLLHGHGFHLPIIEVSHGASQSHVELSDCLN